MTDKERQIEHITDVIDKLTADYDWGYGVYDNYEDPKEHQTTPKLIQSLIEVRDYIRLNRP